MAAEIKRRLGLSASLIEGGRGEFTVWAGPRKVAEKKNGEFPTSEEVVAAVQQALQP